jgi:outer membrane protein assembly factor BamA
MRRYAWKGFFGISLVLVVFAVSFPSLAYPLVENRYLGEVVVIIEGNRKTKTGYVEKLVDKCIEKEEPAGWDALGAESLRQCIFNSRLFADVKVEVDEPRVRLTLDERWTLIPIPFFYSSEETTSAGGYVFESNFLGYGKMVGAGGTISTEGDSFFLFYMDPSVFFSDWTASLNARSHRNEFSLYYGGEDLCGYRLSEKSFGASVGYRVSPTLNASLKSGYAERGYDREDGYEDYDFMDMGGSLHYGDDDYKLYYNEGFSARAGYERQVYRSDHGPMSSMLSGAFKWERNVFSTHAIRGAVSFIRVFADDARDAYTAGHGRGFRGIPKNGLWVDWALATSVDYVIPVKKIRSNVLAVAPFVDYGVFEPVYALPEEYYVSYGVGAYLYVNRINIPGVGIVFGYNENFMGAFATVQLGMMY